MFWHPKVDFVKRNVAKSAFGAVSSLADSAGSAVANFLVGLSAVRSLPDEGIAVFSICMLSFIASMLLPQQIVYFPSRTMSNLSESRSRPSLRRDILKAKYTLLAAALAVVAFTAPFAHLLSLGDYLALAGSTVVASIFGSLQGHMRASLHVIGLHGVAAIISVSSLLVSSALLIVGNLAASAFDTPFRYAVPFVSLSLGFVAGLPIWIGATRTVAPMNGQIDWGFGRRVLFIVPDLTIQITWYLMGLLVVSIIGPAGLASLEAARVVSAPVFVLAGGLSSYFLPIIIRHMAEGRRAVFSRLLIGGTFIIVLCAALYAIAVSVGHSVVALLLQRQYGSELSAGRSISNGLEGASNLLSSVFLASDRPIYAISFVVSSSLIGIALTAPLLVAFGPMGMIIAQFVVSLGRLAMGAHVAARDGVRAYASPA